MNRRNVVLLLLVLVLLVGGAVAVRKLGKAEEARRENLLPQVRSAFDRLRAELSNTHGIELVIVSTRRSAEEQAAKVAAGLSATNNSWHTLGRALDVQTARKGPDGKFVADPNGKDLAAYQTLHRIAKLHGFRGVPNGSPFTSSGQKAYIETSGGRVWDVFHLEYPEGLTFAQAKAQAAQGLA